MTDAAKAITEADGLIGTAMSTLGASAHDGKPLDPVSCQWAYDRLAQARLLLRGDWHVDTNGRPVEAAEVDVTECPDCGQKGRYEGRVLVDGRGYYECPDKHRWQNVNEKPTNKGIRLG